MSKTAEQFTHPDTYHHFSEFLIQAKEWLDTYMKEYYGADIIKVQLFDTAHIYLTAFYRYSISAITVTEGDYTYRYVVFGMAEVDTLAPLIRFPMPATQQEFLEIMRILDIK